MTHHDHVRTAPVLKALNAVDESSALEAIQMFAEGLTRDGHELIAEAAEACRFARVDPDEDSACRFESLAESASKFSEEYNWRLDSDDDGIVRLRRAEAV